MPAMVRQLKRMLLAAVCVAWIVPWVMTAKGQDTEIEVPEADIDLVERSGEIFIGKIDIVTGTYEVLKDCEAECGPGVGTEYTVLVSDVLKGQLEPQSIFVLRQDGGTLSGVAEYHDGDGPLIPGNEYLFFAKYSPGLSIYRITEPVVGTVPVTSDEERRTLTAYWSVVVDRTACSHTDVLTFDSVIYARRDWSNERRYIARDRVGATIATIQFQDTSATGCRDDLADGIASELPIGTKVQRLDNYDPSFRVAVRKRNGHRHLYEAIRSDTAVTGADLLDIAGRVVTLQYERHLDIEECDNVSMCLAPTELVTDDQAVISQVLTMLSEAPVDPARTNFRTQPPERLRLDFNLDDESTVSVQISLRTGLTPSGIEVPLDELMGHLGLD